jgi:hypothetical protein
VAVDFLAGRDRWAPLDAVQRFDYACADLVLPVNPRAFVIANGLHLTGSRPATRALDSKQFDWNQIRRPISSISAGVWLSH